MRIVQLTHGPQYICMLNLMSLVPQVSHTSAPCFRGMVLTQFIFIWLADVMLAPMMDKAMDMGQA